MTFSANHARTVLGLTLELFTVLIERAELAAAGDAEQWVEFAKGRIDVVRATAMSIPHVFPNENDNSDESEVP